MIISVALMGMSGFSMAYTFTLAVQCISAKPESPKKLGYTLLSSGLLCLGFFVIGLNRFSHIVAWDYIAVFSIFALTLFVVNIRNLYRTLHGISQ